MYHKHSTFKHVKVVNPSPATPKKPQFVEKPVGGEKNGGKRMVRVQKLRNYYPTADKVPHSSRNVQCFKNHKRSLRKSLVPGTVCILVAGPHRGRRVIFLKQLKSGLLLVTGPFRINACPLRRINKIYVMATKTRVNLKGVHIPAYLNDTYFRRARQTRPKKGEGDIFATKKEEYKVSEERKKDQKLVDDRLIKAMKRHHKEEKKSMCAYLGSTFSLRSGHYPHRMVF